MTETIKIKDKLLAHIETWRLYTVIWCGLVSLAGSCIAYQDLPPLKNAILVLFIPMMGWIAGLYLADFLDRKLDTIEKPHRPIPSGRIHPYEALVIGSMFAVTGLIFSYLLNIYNLVLVFVTAFLVLYYAKITKSRGIWGNINRGLITVVAYLYGVFSTNQTIQTYPNYVWLLCFVFFIHDTNSNLVGAIRDMEGDKKGGYKTIPVKYGLKISILLSIILTIIWFLIVIILPFKYGFLKKEFYYIMILDLIILLILYLYLFTSIKSYSREKALKFHELFVIERITLASALIFGIIDIKLAAIIYIVAILITIVTQFMLRKRYEFVITK